MTSDLFHGKRQRQQKSECIGDGLGHFDALEADEERQNHDGGDEENALASHG